MSPFFITFSSIFVAAWLGWWLKRVSVKHVKGPPSAYFWLGHEYILRSQDKFGDLETKWCREYGTIYRIKGSLRQDLLVVSDPKALEHIFHSSHPYPKTRDANFMMSLILGGPGGLVVAEKPACLEDDHRRQRKILNPAFSPANLRKFQVIFQQCSDKVVNAMKRCTRTSEPIDVVDWMNKASLDIIGAFRYDFGSLDGRETELEGALRYLHTASWQSNPSLVSTRGAGQLASVGEAAGKVAREILAAQAKLGVQVESDKDIVDILTRARHTGQMRDDEIEPQFVTFLIAGHETTATTLSWLLYELAAHPEHQSIIREEVKHSYHNDYDSLPFLNAAIKESLRLHPFSHTPTRVAPYDDVLPLSGSKTVAIPKGQTLLCSVYLYNRLPSIWGDDVEEWNPARFLNKSVPVSLGVYANLMTFSAGSRSCIWWRFAVMEMQAVLANLVQIFEFSLPEGVEVQQFPGAQAVVPVVKGEAHLDSRVPLRIKSLE
ncbi:PAH-inducible cytochrome P450 monooxygenase PC-PAH 4 [Desarmillaria tabescens]|uniref:PAH-inducible cytochrome P450 monooxygenase PC-PAH 4 n=1 Tax=Armillaria tabescens TaxID=1929756 RepID=A0AA39JGD3_ARMTA|nr:PAH-inducible cytochrome P450 monooxygenase PC-PAH 4 [Desarmillaria tabescens]KAK0442282.1 PAH-inducible cytochrome P450 monooxygenase PC-PAH 4 [Desarmillaria tabescens]